VAEERAARAQELAQEMTARAIERARKAERRAAESALKATERAKKAERRAREAADQAVERVERAAQEPVAEDAVPEEAGRPPASARPPGPVEHYDDLAAEEVIALLASLERDDLEILRDHERAHASRPSVLDAIDSMLARGRSRV
jgi:hypothetical protein